jgi:hypothetical protein
MMCDPAAGPALAVTTNGGLAFPPAADAGNHDTTTNMARKAQRRMHELMHRYLNSRAPVLRDQLSKKSKHDERQLRFEYDRTTCSAQY